VGAPALAGHDATNHQQIQVWNQSTHQTDSLQKVKSAKQISNAQCLNCRWGVGWLNPQLFSQPPNILSNYVLEVSYILYAYSLHHKSLDGLWLSKSTTPPANFLTIKTLLMFRTLQGGPKKRTCLSVDNSAMVSGKKTCDTSKVSECYKNKWQICILKHWNILCLIRRNIRQPWNSAKFDCNTWI